MSSHHTAPARTPARLPSYYGPGHEGGYRWHEGLRREDRRHGYDNSEGTAPQTAEGAYAA
ncbi:hypothetical protein [Streptomyces sp. NPDC059828]|uniref:hypothetical protein n=1 Tax=Streptomyces sp. NPDC059828 TaxID=3346965 RepID=UPI003658E786